MDKKRKIAIGILALIGLILAGKLLNIFMLVNFEPLASKSFCSINSFIDCDGVSQTKYAQVFGVPLCLWGLCFYLFVLFLIGL